MTETATAKYGTLRKRAFAALFSGIMTLSLCLTAFPKTARADQATIDAELIARMKNVVTQLAPTGGTDWQKYLNKRFYIATKLDATGATLNWNTTNSVPSTWKWSGGTAGPAWATGPEKPAVSNCIPYYDSASSTYYVWSGEQLYYALDKLSGSAIARRTISIQEDIDLNGQAGKVWVCTDEMRHLTILGNGHTIYNLRVDDSRESRTAPNTNTKEYAAFIGRAYGLRMEHLTFTNVNICGDYHYVDSEIDGSYRHAAGVIGWLSTTTSHESLIEDVTVKNALIVGGAQVGALSGRTSTTSAAPLDLKNCYAENNICFGEQHISSLCSSINKIHSANYCYSIGSIVISTGGHSGGLFSCGADTGTISNCFVDAEVYGSTLTGVFGGSMSGVGSYSSCFSSGFVEGAEALGGFIGEQTQYNVTFQDCYSTALVGLRSGGNSIGGFLGRRPNNRGSIGNMQNCYAAGETGYTGLDSSGTATEPETNGIGGMIGTLTDHIVTASNCYYDKQTTAMREWKVGNNTSKLNLDGKITGVTTKDSVVSGPGLTCTTPNGTKGFTGFSGTAWDYSAVDHYPELRVFKEATAAEWGTQERANLVKAYSLSSTATMLLDTWDYTLDRATGKIDQLAAGNTLIYDTVRDLTSSFTLTAKDVDNWDRIGEQDSKTHKESKATIAGVEYDVLSLKATGGQYICDELVPGIEWLMVTCSVGGQEAPAACALFPRPASRRAKAPSSPGPMTMRMMWSCFIPPAHGMRRIIAM